MDAPFGAVSRVTTKGLTEWPVVGQYRARDPFGDLSAGVVIAGSPDLVASNLRIVVTTPDAVATAMAAVVPLIDAPQASDLNVTAPLSLAELRSGVSSDLGAFARTLLWSVLGLGALLVAVVTLADVLVRRTDLGRRRTLGATRATIVALVVFWAGFAATAGVLVGTATGLVIGGQLGVAVPADFGVGVAVLALMTSVTAAVPPAFFAATRDPARELRTL